jgi:hypothetical protein
MEQDMKVARQVYRIDVRNRYGPCARRHAGQVMQLLKGNLYECQRCFELFELIVHAWGAQTENGVPTTDAPVRVWRRYLQDGSDKHWYREDDDSYFATDTGISKSGRFETFVSDDSGEIRGWLLAKTPSTV